MRLLRPGRFVVLALAALSAAAPGSGRDVPVDTGAVAAFGAAGDSAGALWVALGWPDDKLQVFRSTDQGESWHSALWFGLDGTARRIEVLAAPGSPGRVLVFCLSAAGAGDLWLCRIRPDSLTWDTVPVAVGPDTIDDFSVTADCDSSYWLYCLYVNEHRGGLNGRFTRSFDRGLTWEFRQDWWNAWDPHISSTRGPLIHAVWRYAGNGREIHYAASRHYGRPAFWGDYRVLKSGGPKCWDPVAVAADTAGPPGPVVWAFYTVGRRDTAMADLEYCWSPDGGRNWNTGCVLGERFIDEWGADLQADRRGPPGFVDLCYNFGGAGGAEPTQVVWRCASAADPELWSDPHVLADARADPRAGGCRPRIAYPGVRTPRGPAVFFSRHRAGGPEGVYLDAPWRPFPPLRPAADPGPEPACLPNPARGLVAIRLPAPGPALVLVCDVSGRVIRSLRVGPGMAQTVWDCTDGSGRPAAAGTYIVHVRAGEVSGRTTLKLHR
ncbi:hypothetical protein FJY71_01635 [candidate division WOR-3 bacterium]|nr:hypothetical protein [candidate division WOR-3 bacterium]